MASITCDLSYLKFRYGWHVRSFIQWHINTIATIQPFTSVCRRKNGVCINGVCGKYHKQLFLQCPVPGGAGEELSQCQLDVLQPSPYTVQKWEGQVNLWHHGQQLYQWALSPCSCFFYRFGTMVSIQLNEILINWTQFHTFSRIS